MPAEIDYLIIDQLIRAIPTTLFRYNIVGNTLRVYAPNEDAADKIPDSIGGLLTETAIDISLKQRDVFNEVRNAESLDEAIATIKRIVRNGQAND